MLSKLVNDNKLFISVIGLIGGRQAKEVFELWGLYQLTLMAWERQHFLCLVEITAGLESLGFWITYRWKYADQ